MRLIGLTGHRFSWMRRLLTSRSLWRRSGLGFSLRWRSRSRRSGTATRSTRSSRAKRNHDTLLLAWSGFGVDVVFPLVVYWTSIKGIISVVGDSATRPYSKSVCMFSTDIALKLGCGRCQDTAPSVGIREATITVKAVTSSRESVTTDTVLTVVKLAKES